MLALYDTRRRRRVDFRPRGRTVTLYVCGITPYDTTHLGHARTFLVFDVLVRHLEAGGLRVRYAQNVTDVDESILQRAARDGLDWRALVAREERRFLQDMRTLGWRAPDLMPHATREMPAMLRLAEMLERRGRAYRIGGGLYFDVSTFPRFGELSRYSAAKMRKILAQQDDTRLDDPHKRAPLDFAVWRRLADGPTWPSPYGEGRPGWHLECSAMALAHLGQPVDLHGGGGDLVYPHHECEIAQTEGATGRPFVRYWVHVGPMRFGGEKMSKSRGNMVFVRDALARASPDGLRLYLLSKHYRAPFDHDEASLAVHDALARDVREAAVPASRARLSREAQAALDADLDTPRAIRLLRRSVRKGDVESATALARRLGLGAGV